MQLELVRKLRDQSDHARIVRARRKLREDRLLAPDEEFDAEDAVATERLDNLAGLMARGKKRPFGERGGLPAFAIVSRFLAMANGWAEQDAILGRDGEKRDPLSKAMNSSIMIRGRSPRIFSTA